MNKGQAAGYWNHPITLKHVYVKYVLVKSVLRVLWGHAMKRQQSGIDGLVQERRNSSAAAMELRLSCTNTSVYSSRLLGKPVTLFCCKNMYLDSIMNDVIKLIYKSFHEYDKRWDRYTIWRCAKLWVRWFLYGPYISHCGQTTSWDILRNAASGKVLIKGHVIACANDG